MINLLIKDFKLLFSSSSSLKKRIVEGIFKIIFLSIFISFMTVLFMMILNKVKSYPKASESFLILFLFVISCIMIIIDLFTANKLFFKEIDNTLTHLPVSNEEIITSKLLFLLGFHYLTSIIFTYPIFIAYGINLRSTPWYYFLSLFYPLLSFIFEMGIALILVYPFKLVLDYLKKHILIQFIVSSIIMITGCILYSKVLSLFMDLVVANNLNSLFTTESLNRLQVITSYMLPIGLLIKSYIGISRSMLQYLLIALGVFILGMTLISFSYAKLRAVKFNKKEKKDKDKHIVKGVNRILIDKELSLLFKDSNNIFSFSGLLLVQPFLMYLVIDSLNKVFSSGPMQYYMLALPQFIPAMDCVLAMLFTIIINSGANSYIDSERKTMKIMKTMPVSYLKQLFIKTLVPYLLSALALICSEIVLISTHTISLMTFIFSLVLTLSLLIIYELASLNEELKIRNNKPRESFISSLYAYLVPILFFIITLLLASLGINPILIYSLGFLIIILLALPFIINIKKRILNAFIDLEVIN